MQDIVSPCILKEGCPMEYPTGTVTFLFTDIEGSTKLAQKYPEPWELLRERHHAILKSAIELHNGYVFQIIGDAFCAAFHTAGDALLVALKSQNDLQTEKWGEAIIKVRMGIHTGKAEIQNGGDYHGYLTMSRVQRVMSIANGGQILISNTSAELIRGELPKGVSLRDMKEHRLKGLLNPEHLWQAVSPDLPDDFPPLQSLNDIPNNLPVQLTSFIGRENEITELKQELNDHHLVTLTGSGGTGKTRLSLQVAAEVLDSFPDGVWFLELAPVTDPALVPNTLANLLGLRESAETKQSISELVCGYFLARKALLIFDNCEHLIESCAQLADLLLRSCKDVRILASSREALGVAGELAWHVPSLSLPDIKNLPTIEQLSQYEAVRLFIERAALVQPHFLVTKESAPAIAQICFRLDGIPLALELAAARINVLAVDQIAKRLDDRFRLLTGGARTALPRQQTLRALIDWSYNLLSEEESLLFRRLAVFVGGWTLEAAEAVCSGDGIEPYLVLDLLSQLVKKSLVVMTAVNGESRYHKLETIRQYAREKLFETDEAAHIRDGHLDYFIQLAEQGFEELHGSNDLIWIEKLETENDNFRTALSWSLESPDLDPQKALQLSGALLDFWDTRGYTSEGVQWLSDALKRAPVAPTGQRCRALLGAGLLCARISQNKNASLYFEDALNMARQLNIEPLIIRSLGLSSDVMEDREEARKRSEKSIVLARTTQNQYYLAESLGWWAITYSDNTPDTIRCIEEAFEIAEKLGNARLHAFVLWEYGGIEMRRANHDVATSMIQEALNLGQLLKDRHLTAHCLLMLGRTATRQATYDAAIQYEDESLQIFRDLSDQTCYANCLFHIGWNAFLAGDIRPAVQRFHECLSISREIDNIELMSMPMFALGRIAIVHGDIHKAKGFLIEALDLHKKVLDSLYYLAYCLEATCAIPSLPPDKTARLLGKAEALREQKGYILPIAERHLVDPIIERLQSLLGKEAFDSARIEGKALTIEQVINDAIEVLQIIE
jgi:predicted ATPase/class 3 adenylate cyclase